MDPADLRSELRNEAHALAARWAMAIGTPAHKDAGRAVKAAEERIARLEGAGVATAFRREAMDTYVAAAAGLAWQKRLARWINRRVYKTKPETEAQARASIEMMKGALEEQFGLACAVQRAREPIPDGWQAVGGCGPYRIIAERDLLTAMRETREREEPR